MIYIFWTLFQTRIATGLGVGGGVKTGHLPQTGVLSHRSVTNGLCGMLSIWKVPPFDSAVGMNLLYHSNVVTHVEIILITYALKIAKSIKRFPLWACVSEMSKRTGWHYFVHNNIIIKIIII